jgi:hypothetical protein
MGHHLIHGKTTDFITGKTVVDTDDERIRQKLARFLVYDKGFEKADIESKIELEIICGHEKATAVIDFIIRLDSKRVIVIRYGPGSLVSRERPAIASARIIEPYQIPFVVITNGQDAEVIDTMTGDIISYGIESIPSKNELKERVKKIVFKEITSRKRETEVRFLFAYEAIEHSSECDDEFCITKIHNNNK